MFLWGFVIFSFSVASCQADVEMSSVTLMKYQHTIEELKTHPTMVFYNSSIECTHIGRYPYPYDCELYYICDKIKNSLESKCDHLKEGIGCIVPTKVCYCPDDTFWGGPLVGCVNDSKDMHACCSFKPDCDNRDGGDFGTCSLSTLGYKYSCCRNHDAIYVDKCETYEGSKDGCSAENPSKLPDLDAKVYKMPHSCYHMKHIIAFDERDGPDNLNKTKETYILFFEYVDEK